MNTPLRCDDQRTPSDRTRVPAGHRAHRAVDGARWARNRAVTAAPVRSGTDHYARFDAKPEITGPWQVGGRNHITDFEQVVKLETGEIRECNLGLSLFILLRTVPAVFKMRGAR